MRHRVERQPLGDFGADESASRRNLADGRDELGRRTLLREVSRCARADCPHRILMLLVHAEHEDAQLRPFRLDLLDELDTALPRHRHVEQQHVELERAHTLEHAVSVGGLAHDVEVASGKQQLLQPLAQDLMVIRDDDARHADAIGASAGSRTTMVVPSPGALMIDASPPISDARSRRPKRPSEPGLRGACGEKPTPSSRSEEHTSELQSHVNLVCRLLLEKKKNNIYLKPKFMYINMLSPSTLYPSLLLYYYHSLFRYVMLMRSVTTWILYC